MRKLLRRTAALGAATGVAAVVFLPLMIASGQVEEGPDMQEVAAVSGISARMLAAYQEAATGVARHAPTCRGMTWPILAGIAKVESNHAAGHTIDRRGDVTPHIIGPRLDGSGAGGNTSAITDTDRGRWDGDAVYDRAVGPLQFLPSTWESMGRDGNGDGVRSPHNVDDAALGAAVYLCGHGRNLADRAQLRDAVFSYNHSHAYVDEVLRWVDRYTRFARVSSVFGAGASKGAEKAIRAALSQRGVPYSWGGGTAQGPSRGVCCSPGGKSGAHITGFDCSGLTLYAFAQAGVRLPRTAAAQAGVGRRIPAAQGVSALKPGDLVFFAYNPGSDATIYHVGIYLGGGQMVNAPRPGTVVRTEPVWEDGFAGGARIL
ncbi:NlpC/P60 family protein [Streptomyces megasporus]|uniref:C40 family peptidase n=1 Tax=Streptomyces megasporus TaxID=44060 RepID=UPI000AA86438|nr:NlpC/P60 family protein [Streptomyces megasporus]